MKIDPAASRSEARVRRTTGGKSFTEDIFPPITLTAGRPQWTLRDKLARLVSLSRQIGYSADSLEGEDPDLMPLAEMAEERALFDELVALLEQNSNDPR